MLGCRRPRGLAAPLLLLTCGLCVSQVRAEEAEAAGIEGGV